MLELIYTARLLLTCDILKTLFFLIKPIAYKYITVPYSCTDSPGSSYMYVQLNSFKHFFSMPHLGIQDIAAIVLLYDSDWQWNMFLTEKFSNLNNNCYFSPQWLAYSQTSGHALLTGQFSRSWKLLPLHVITVIVTSIKHSPGHGHHLWSPNGTFSIVLTLLGGCMVSITCSCILEYR